MTNDETVWRVEIKPQATPGQVATVEKLLALYSSKKRRLPIDSSIIYDILLLGDCAMRLDKALQKHRGYVEVNFLRGGWGHGR